MCPEDWEWSSYRATAGIIKATDFLTTEWVLGQFSQNKAEAKRRYVQFVREGIKSKTESPWQQLKGRIFFGSSLIYIRNAGEIMGSLHYCKSGYR